MDDIYIRFQPIRAYNPWYLFLTVPLDWAAAFGFVFMLAKAARMGWGE